MLDPKIQNAFAVASRMFCDALQRTVIAMEQLNAELARMADPVDIDDDPAFARFCEVLRRW